MDDIEPIRFTERQWTCLADAIYIESRGEPEAGQRAVAQVILNRVSHPEFPDTICDVVSQPGQFPWWGVLNPPRTHPTYQRIRDLAGRLIAKKILGIEFGPSETSNSTFFNGVPFRYERLTFSAQIGNHLFYELRD